jgi:hypothetical protein
MPKRHTPPLARAAAIRLIFSLALVLAGSCVLLEATLWKNIRPEPPEPFYTELPGVDLSGLPPATKEALLKRLNAQHCPCDCMRTIASCRNHHGSCSMSLALAREAVRQARRP